MRTGVSILSQVDLLEVKVNGLFLGEGHRIALPRTVGSMMEWARVIPDIGEHKLLWFSYPLIQVSYRCLFTRA